MYHGDRDYIIKWYLVLLDKHLAYEDEPIVILDWDIPKLRNKRIYFVKVQWKNHLFKEAPWEIEKDMWDKYPQLLRKHVLSFCQFLVYFFIFDHLRTNNG